MEQINLARPDAPTDAPIYSVTVEEAAAQYEKAGIPRTIRRIQKYCARGDLDCKKLETDAGEKYFITALSIERHVAQILDAQAAAGRVGARPDASDLAPQPKDIFGRRKGRARSAPQRPATPGRARAQLSRSIH